MCRRAINAPGSKGCFAESFRRSLTGNTNDSAKSNRYWESIAKYYAVYGGQIWLNTDGEYFNDSDIPVDTYMFTGHQGQMVVVVSSMNVVAGIIRALP